MIARNSALLGDSQRKLFLLLFVVLTFQISLASSGGELKRLFVGAHLKALYRYPWAPGCSA